MRAGPLSIIIFFLLLRPGCGLKYWDDYVDFSRSKDFEQRLVDEARGLGYQTLFAFPPYVCSQYRQLVYQKFEDFSATLQAVLKSKSLSQWFVELFTSERETKFFEAYTELVSSSYSYFFAAEEEPRRTADANTPAKALADPALKGEPVVETSRWLDKAHKFVFSPKHKNPANFDRDLFDFGAIGQFYGRLLFNGDFSCIEIPELSLLVFKLFYFRVFEERRIGAFFRGFFQVFEEIDPRNEAAELFSTDSVNTFFGYNILVLLGLKSAYAQQLLDTFSADPERKAALIDNFALLYSVVLETIEIAERSKAKEKDEFVKDLLALKGRAVEKAARKTAFFALKFIQGVILGYVLGPLGKVGAFVAGEAFESELGAIQKGLKEIIDPEDKGGDQVLVSVEGVASALEVSHLRDFLGYFETQVFNHKDCVFCYLHLRNQRQNLDKIARRNSIHQLI